MLNSFLVDLIQRELNIDILSRINNRSLRSFVFRDGFSRGLRQVVKVPEHIRKKLEEKQRSDFQKQQAIKRSAARKLQENLASKEEQKEKTP